MELAVITGANRGIGFETARQLATRELRVIVTGRDPAKIQQAAARLTESSGSRAVEARALDVTDPSSVTAFADRLRAEGTPVNVLVNNAAVSLSGFDAELAARTLATNYFGAAAVTDALAPLIPARGRVVMLSSGMGELSVVGPELRERFMNPELERSHLDALMNAFVEAVRAGRHRTEGWPGNAYSVSKVGLNALVRVLAPAFRLRGVLINAVCPGWVRTDMGGRSAPRSVEQGAASVVWAALLPPDGPSGGFFRDGREIPW